MTNGTVTRFAPRADQVALTRLQTARHSARREVKQADHARGLASCEAGQGVRLDVSFDSAAWLLGKLRRGGVAPYPAVPSDSARRGIRRLADRFREPI